MSGRRILIQLVKIAVSVGLIAFLFYKLSPENLLVASLPREPVAARHGDRHLLRQRRSWGRISGISSSRPAASRFPSRRRSRSISSACSSTIFCPRASAGTSMKIYDVTRVGNDPHQVFAVTMLDRVIGIAGLCVLALVASFILLAGDGLYNLRLYIVIFAGCVAPVLALIMNKRLSRGVRSLFGKITLWGLGGRFDTIFRHLGEYRRLRMLLVAAHRARHGRAVSARRDARPRRAVPRDRRHEPAISSSSSCSSRSSASS